MKKQYIYGLLTLTAFAATGFTSCSSEEDFGGVVGKEMTLTLSVNKEGEQTRTQFEEVGGDLLCTWTAGDALLVTDKSGNRLGVITLTDGAGTNTGMFRGQITVPDGANTFNIFYLGNKKTIPEELEGTSFVYNLSAQDGTFASLATNDLMMSEVTPAILDDNDLSGVTTMYRHFAEGHFYLDLPGGVELAAGDVVTITDSEGDFNTAPTFKYNTGGSIVGKDNGTLTVTKTEKGNDIYVTIFPQTITPTFTVTTAAGKTYTATLGQRLWKAGEYVRTQTGTGASTTYSGVTVTNWTEQTAATSDGKILGIKWAEVNDRSYIDCSPYSDDAYYISYIPGIALSEQGLKTVFISSGIINPNSNTYVYHYQWGRNFGFPASYDSLADLYVPNHSNLPNSWSYNYHYYSVDYGPGTPQESIQLPDTYIVRTDGGPDWCSTNFASWPMYDDEGMLLSVAPKGFRLPTKADFEILLPEGTSGNSYTATKNFSVKGETIRPVFAKTTSDGTTVVWAILNSSTNYLALYELSGNHSLSDLTADMFGDNGIVLDYIDFPAHGCRSATSGNPQMQYWQASGWYWASTSGSTGYGDMFRFDISGNTITLYVAMMPKRNAMSVRCIYDE